MKYLIQENGSVLQKCERCLAPSEPLTLRRTKFTDSLGGMSTIDMRMKSTRDIRSKSLSRMGTLEVKRVFFAKTQILLACLACQNLGEVKE